MSTRWAAAAAPEEEVFEEGEEVLAFFGHQLFSGVIVLVDESKAPNKHLVHYHGWNHRFEPLVPRLPLSDQQTSVKCEDL
jgi:hypothetical protein